MIASLFPTTLPRRHLERSIGTGILDGSGIATLTTSLLVVGNHNITVSYPGDFNFQPNTSAIYVQVITGDPTTLR